MRSIKLCLKWGGEQNMISLKAKTNYSANNIQPIDRKVIPTEFKILFIVLLLLANYVMAPRYSFATNHPKYKSYNQQSSKNKSCMSSLFPASRFMADLNLLLQHKGYHTAYELANNYSELGIEI